MASTAFSIVPIGRDHENLDPGMVLSHGLKHLQTVHMGHLEVRDDEVGAVLR